MAVYAFKTELAERQTDMYPLFGPKNTMLHMTTYRRGSSLEPSGVSMAVVATGGGKKEEATIYMTKKW